MTQKKQNISSDIDLTTEIAIGTISLAVIGVTYGWFFYGAFKINIFDYMQASDFISLAFRNPWIVFFSGISALIIQFALKTNRTLKLTLFPIFSILFSIIFANQEVNQVKSKNGRLASESPCTVVEYLENKSGTIKKRVTPLGTAGDHFLYYSTEDRATFILDKRSVNRIICSSQSTK